MPPIRRHTSLLLTALVAGVIGILSLSAHPSYGIRVGEDGTVYFADVMHLGRGALWALRPDGRLDTLMRDFHAHSLAFDENGLLYAAHGEEPHLLISFLPLGEDDTLIATDDEERFFGGNWAMSPSGEVYFGINNRVWRYSDSISEPVTDLHLEWTQSLFVDTKGRIYATEIGSYNGELWRIDPEDSTYHVIASDLITTRPDRTRKRHEDVLCGISQDAYGNIYVAETAGRRIIRIDTSGCVSTFYVSRDHWFPTGVAFHNDIAYVMEVGYDSAWVGPRILKVDPDGDRTVLVEIDAVPEPPAEDSIYLMPFVAAGVMLLVGLATWLTFRTRPGEENSDTPEDVPPDTNEPAAPESP